VQQVEQEKLEILTILRAYFRRADQFFTSEAHLEDESECACISCEVDRLLQKYKEEK
jgi:hypothetical protein